MKKNIITISDNGSVYVPTNVQMRDFEIAELFGVMVPIVRSNIRVILKSGIVTADTHCDGTFCGNTFYPDYYGLDMIMALAFRIQSLEAEDFRIWILSKATKKEYSMINQQVFISIDKSINRLNN